MNKYGPNTHEKLETVIYEMKFEKLQVRRRGPSSYKSHSSRGYWLITRP